MATQSDLFARLESLFAAERESRLDSMEVAVRALRDEPRPQSRLAALTRLAHDAHALKGAAQIETRQELCDVITAFERRMDAMLADDPAPGEVDELLRALTTLRSLSRGIVTSRELE